MTYVHSEWNTDWGGEFIIYHARKDSRGDRVLEVAQCIAPQPAILPEVEGHGWFTGRHEFMIDPDDPLKEGFLLG